jgi:guanylate kinase
MEAIPGLRFSTSATTRGPRQDERDGEDYYFLSTDDFRHRVDEDAFIEWEEVYPGTYYGTLRGEIERIADEGAALLDIDVKGALNVKRRYGSDALTLFIRPPSLAVLAERLQQRKTETADSLAQRIERARIEISYESEFDAVIVNDDLETAVEETLRVVRQFLGSSRFFEHPGSPVGDAPPSGSSPS